MDVVTLNQIKKLRETMGASNIKQDFGLAIDNLLLNLDGFSKINQGEYIEDYFRVTPVTSLLAGQNLSSNYKVFPDYEHHKLALVGYVSSRYYAAWIDMSHKTVLDVKEITYQSSWQNYSAMYNARSTQKNGVIIEGKLYCFIDRKRYIIYDMDTYELEIKEMPGNFGMGVYGRGLHIVADGENKKLYLVGGTSETSTNQYALYPAFLGLYELDPQANTLTLLTQSRIMTAMFINPWDTTYNDVKFFSAVRFNQATKCIEGAWQGNYYQFNVENRDFIKRTRKKLSINEPQIMRHLTKVTVKDKLNRFIKDLTNMENITPDNYRSVLNTDVLDTDYSVTPCLVQCTDYTYANWSIYLELAEEVEIDVIKLNTGGTSNQSYLGNFYVYTYNQAKNQVAQFSASNNSPFMFPAWSSGRVHDQVKYIEFRLHTNSSFFFHGIEFFQGFKYYSAADSTPTNWVDATITNNGLVVSNSNSYKYYLEFGESTKLDYMLAFSSNYGQYGSTYNPYYVKVDAANDLEGPWTTVLNPTNHNASVSNRYKFPLSTGGNEFKYYRIYTTQNSCNFRFFPVTGNVFDWNGVDESVTYQSSYNASFYNNIMTFLASVILGTNTYSSATIQCYDSANNALTRQYWMELPTKPIGNAKYILTSSTSLGSQLTSSFRIQVKQYGLTAWANIALKDTNYIPVQLRTGQIAGTGASTLYLYELETEVDIDSIRVEQIPIDQTSLSVPIFYFVSEEDVESLGTFINPVTLTNPYWYDYLNLQIDAPVTVANDAYLHTDTHLHRFCHSRNKLIKIDKETGLPEEFENYINYLNIRAPLKQLNGEPTKYIMSEQFQGLNTYGLKVYDTVTDTFTTLLLPTTTNLNDMAATQCYIDELKETAYFFNYANTTNQLVEMNFQDDMGVELAGESFAYLRAIQESILSLTFNRQDGSTLQTSFKMAVDQSLYLVFKNGGKVSVQSGKIFALWGEK